MKTVKPTLTITSLVLLLIVALTTQVCALPFPVNLKKISKGNLFRGKVNKETKENMKGKGKEEDNKNFIQKNGVSARAESDHMFKSIDKLYDTLDMKIQKVSEQDLDDKVKTAEAKGPFFYDKEHRTLFVSESHLYRLDQKEKILYEIGNTWAGEWLDVHIEAVQHYVNVLLDKLKIEAREAMKFIDDEEDAPSLCAVEYLDLSFIMKYNNPMNAQQLEQHKEDLAAMFGKMFSYYYSNAESRTLLEQCSPVLFNYMNKIHSGTEQQMFTYLYYAIKPSVDEQKIKQNNENFIRSTANCNMELKQTLEQYRTGSFENSTFSGMGNEILRQYDGNMEAMWDVYTSLVQKQKDNTVLPTHETLKMLSVIHEINEINSWIKQPVHITKTTQIVHTYFDAVDLGCSFEQTNIEETKKNFSYGFFPDLRIAEVIDQNTDREIQVEVEVPPGTYVAPLGEGKVIFPTEYGVQLKEGTEIEVETKQLTPKRTATVLKMKVVLVSKHIIEKKMLEENIEWVNTKLVPLLRHKKVSSNVLFNLHNYVKFRFYGMSASNLMRCFEQPVEDWFRNNALNKRFYNDFFQAFESNRTDPNGGIVFSNVADPTATIITTRDCVLGDGKHLNICLDFFGYTPQTIPSHIQNMLSKAIAYGTYKNILTKSHPSLDSEMQNFYETEYLKMIGIVAGLEGRKDKEHYFMLVFDLLFPGQLEKKLNDDQREMCNFCPKTIDLIGKYFEKQKYFSVQKLLGVFAGTHTLTGVYIPQYHNRPGALEYVNAIRGN